jgi:hypothetical protein
VLLEEKAVEWRVLDEGSYRLLQPVNGVFHSEIFPGFWLDEAAFWAADSKGMLSVLQQGLASNECRAFLARLL